MNRPRRTMAGKLPLVLCIVLLSWLGGLPAQGCQVGSLPVANEGVASLVMQPSETVEVGVTKLTVIDVQDSRCPQGVQCIWAGRVTVTLQVKPPEDTLTTVSLTLGVGQSEEASQTVGAYRLTLVAVDPYPQSAQPLSLDDYQVTVQVEPSSGEAATP